MSEETNQNQDVQPQLQEEKSQEKGKETEEIKREETREKPERDEQGRFLVGNETSKLGGRPPGSFSLKTILADEIQKQPEGQKLTYALALIKKQLHQAIIDGDTQTQKLIWGYLEGLPTFPVEHSGEVKTYVIRRRERDRVDPVSAAPGPMADNRQQEPVQDDSMRPEVRQDDAGDK